MVEGNVTVDLTIVIAMEQLFKVVALEPELMHMLPTPEPTTINMSKFAVADSTLLP